MSGGFLFLSHEPKESEETKKRNAQADAEHFKD